MLVDLEETVISIKRGRHPVIPLLFPSGDQFVANDTKLKVGYKLLEFEMILYFKCGKFCKKCCVGLCQVFWKRVKTFCCLVCELRLLFLVSESVT